MWRETFRTFACHTKGFSPTRTYLKATPMALSRVYSGISIAKIMRRKGHMSLSHVLCMAHHTRKAKHLPQPVCTRIQFKSKLN